MCNHIPMISFVTEVCTFWLSSPIMPNPHCPPLATTNLLVSMSLLFWGFLVSFGLKYSTYRWAHAVFIWLISLSIMPFRLIRALTNGNTAFFNGWMLCIMCVCIYIYTPHLFYPLIHWWTLRLFPYIDYYTECFNKQLVHISFWIIFFG